MNTFIKYIVGLVVCLSISIPLFSQKSVLEQRADKQFMALNYYKAIDMYSSVKKLTLDGTRNLAQSYSKTGAISKAIELYASIAENPAVIPTDFINYANLLKINGEYDKAIIWMDKYKSASPLDLRVKNYEYNKPAFDKLLVNNQIFAIFNLDLNTDADDFAPSFYNDSVIFISNKLQQHIVRRIYNSTQKPFYDIFLANVNENQLINPRKLDVDVNKKLHEGPASFAKDAETLAYTKNNYNAKSKDGYNNLNIFFKSFVGNAWQKETPFKYNSADYSTGHPYLSNDGKTMYFSSNMPGGFGGADLYKITADENGNWTTAINMGDKINTEGDELYPFYEEKSGVLFFTSNGHFGLGGLDIFAAKINQDKSVGKILNVGVPVNSQYDDFAFVLNNRTNKGYFSSNRKEGKGGDDIFAFNQLKPLSFEKSAKGIVKYTSGQLASGVTILLIDENGQRIAETKTDSLGAYFFQLQEGGKYKLIASKEKYYDLETNISTSDSSSDEINANLVLESIPDLSYLIVVKDKATGSPLADVKITIKNNLADGEAGVFKSSSEGKFVKVLNNKVNDKISYQLSFDKEGYLSKSTNFNQRVDNQKQYLIEITLDKIDVGIDLAKLINLKPIYFDKGKFTIRKDAAIELDKVVKIMNENPTMEVELGSHTDCRGANLSNETLSNKRAIASADYIKKRITNPVRIYGKGYGEYKLINSCACEGNIKSTCTEAEHQLNRRTEFIIKKVK